MPDTKDKQVSFTPTLQSKSGPTQHEETLRKGAHPNREQEEVHVAPKGRVNKAKARGPHGRSTSADGTPYLQPVKNGKTSGGVGGL